MTLALKAQSEGSEKAREFSLSDKHFAAISTLVRNEVGINLTEAKRDLVYSRLVKRLRALRLDGFSAYIDLVGSSSGAVERQELISAITTNVTNFYREPHHFEHLRAQAIPDIKNRLDAGETGRIWSAGCSDGREPYTIACSVLQEIPDALRRNVKILASDIDHRSLDIAKAGKYNADIVSKMPRYVLERYFNEVQGGAEAGPDIRALISFRFLNLLGEWPFKQKFDVIFCRNVLIYFEQDLQAQIIARFCSVLKPGGYLYIGHSERVSGIAASKLTQVGITTYRHEPARGRT